MKIRNSFYFSVGVLLVIPLGYFLLDRARFVLTAQETLGTVQNLTASNGRCGSRRSKHDCTEYRATVRYEVNGETYWIDITAGNARGHDQPTSMASYPIGGQERIAYDPRKPLRAYRNALWDIWGAPIMTFFVQLAMFAGGLKEQQRRSRDDD